MLTEKRKKYLEKHLIGALKHTQGTMPIGLPLDKQEEVDYINDIKKGRKHTKLVEAYLGD